ncbi:MAG: PH domain-containing protein [Bacilli bacterium]|nr:PH domain-containing protein [Bacilli bacterium]
MGIIYNMVKDFKSKYWLTIAIRLKSHCSVAEMYLNPGEEVLFAFPAQMNERPYLLDTVVIVLTDKRILVCQKRLFWGHTYYAITPDMFNDLKIYTRLFWSKIKIDTVKELIVLSNIDKRGADDIETKISTFMMEEKKKYKIGSDDK